MPITEIRVGFARTFVPPGGDRYQPLKIDAGLTITIEPGDDIEAVRCRAQVDLRTLLEETYRAQHKPKKAEERAAIGQTSSSTPGTFSRTQPEPEY